MLWDQEDALLGQPRVAAWGQSLVSLWKDLLSLPLLEHSSLSLKPLS